MKRLFTLLFCAALLGASAGCSDDKDDATVDAALLVGTWKMTATYDGEYDRWEYDVTADPLTLNADGTGSEGPAKYEHFTWHCAGNTLVLDFGNGDIVEGIVEKLTDNELIISSGDYEGEDGEIYADKTVYERIN